MDHDTMLEEEGAAVRGNPLKKAGKKVYSKGKVGLSTAHGVAEDFKNFINKGNVFDLAVGVIMGAAFTTIVKSLVDDIFTPIIGLISDKNLENMFFVLRCPEINVGDPPVKRRPGRAVCANSWKTVEEAHKDGAVTWNWGTFTQRVINFLLVSIIVFFMVKIYSAAFFRKDETKVKECPDCTKEIPIKAKRCPECTASLGSQSDLGERASLLSMKDL